MSSQRNDMDNFDTKSPPAFLRRLLIEPEYRAARHLLLLFVLVVTALNQAFMTMRAGLEQMGNGIFLQAGYVFITYLVACYFNLWVLLPRYLLKKKYLLYTLYLAATVLLLVVLQTVEERAVLLHFDILDEFYKLPRVVITILSSFALVLLCISGGAMTVLLKHWMINNQKVSQLEKLHIQSEVEQLKEQVNPHLLFNILNRTGVLAKHRPGEASDMLLRLSQLLRYQLYDCNRERVLLSAEIKFLNNYLTLEKMYSDSFEFGIEYDQGCSHILVSPLLFISFVQAAVIRIYEKDRRVKINIRFESDEQSVTFVCRCDMEDLFRDMNFSKIGRRLDILYKNRYSLAVADKEITLNLEIEDGR